MQTIKYHLLVLSVPGLLFVGCTRNQRLSPVLSQAYIMPKTVAETKTSPEGDEKESNSAATGGERSNQAAADEKGAQPTELSTQSRIIAICRNRQW